jgi:hypothetical protein
MRLRWSSTSKSNSQNGTMFDRRSSGAPRGVSLVAVASLADRQSEISGRISDHSNFIFTLSHPLQGYMSDYYIVSSRNIPKSLTNGISAGGYRRFKDLRTK